jgi:hypothetical protein
MDDFKLLKYAVQFAKSNIDDIMVEDLMMPDDKIDEKFESLLKRLNKISPLLWKVVDDNTQEA